MLSLPSLNEIIVSVWSQTHCWISAITIPGSQGHEGVVYVVLFPVRFSSPWYVFRMLCQQNCMWLATFLRVALILSCNCVNTDRFQSFVSQTICADIPNQVHSSMVTAGFDLKWTKFFTSLIQQMGLNYAQSIKILLWVRGYAYPPLLSSD